MNLSIKHAPSVNAVTLLLWAASWLFLSWFTPSSILWRDSGEFIIQGTYLDVAHPAGFPLYGQLAHLFAQIPFGPLAWRINLFSTFLAACALSLSYLLSVRVLTVDLRLSDAIARLCALLIPVLLLCTETFLRQAFAAEVYILSFNLLLILFLYTHSWWHDRKNNSLLAAAFIAGLALGNHVSLALTYLLILPIFLFNWKRTKQILLQCLLCFLIGLTIYLYIPIRAHNNLPLNTGMATSWQRFVSHVSNARDWTIRGIQANQQSSQNHETASIKKTFHILNLNFSEIAIHDGKRLVAEISLISTLFGLVGIVIILIKSHTFGLILTLSALSTWGFFSGWHPDPWLPIFFTFQLGAASSLALLTQQLQKRSTLRGLPVAVSSSLAALLILGSVRPNLAMELESYRSYKTTLEEGRARLRDTAPNSFYLSEPSLFLLLYTTAVEGYRDDVSIVYLLDLYYPELFVKRTWQRSDGVSFSPDIYPLPHLPSLDNVSNFVNFISNDSILYAEPVTLLNSYLREVVKLNNHGLLELKQNQSASLDPEFMNQILRELERLIEHFYKMPKTISQDVAAYIELRAMLYADLLYSMKRPLRAAQVLSMLCDQPDRRLCFAPVENNLKAYRALLYDKSSKEDVNN